MADFLMLTEGKNELIANGLPTTCFFDLSTQAIGTMTASTTFGGGYGIATGTGYSAQSQAEPTPSAGAAAFSLMTWSTGAATDWPSQVFTVVLRTASKLICAWHLQTGGAARNMSGANTVENFTPTLTLT
jgi:hypothetical protein